MYMHVGLLNSTYCSARVIQAFLNLPGILLERSQLLTMSEDDRAAKAARAKAMVIKFGALNEHLNIEHLFYFILPS